MLEADIQLNCSSSYITPTMRSLATVLGSPCLSAAHNCTFDNHDRISLLRCCELIVEVWEFPASGIKPLPKAIQDLLDELEASRQARQRAWDVLQDLRAVSTNLGSVTIEVPSRKTFETEQPILNFRQQNWSSRE